VIFSISNFTLGIKREYVMAVMPIHCSGRQLNDTVSKRVKTTKRFSCLQCKAVFQKMS